MTRGRIDLCLAAKRFYPTFTGAGMRFRRYAPGLGTRGIDMRVFAGTPEGNEKSRSGALLPIEYLNGLPVQRVQLSGEIASLRDIQYARALLRHSRHPTTRPDLIHFTSSSLYWPPYYLALRRLGIPIVQSHTLLAPLSSKSWKRRLQCLRRRLLFQFADCVVTPSAAGRDALRDLGVTPRIVVIPHGLDLNRFKPIASTEKKLALRDRLGLDPTAKFILFVGALIERKGVGLLIRAWRSIAKECPHTYLLLVGPKPQEMGQGLDRVDFQNEIAELVPNSGAAHRIIFTGNVENVVDYYQTADLFLFPSQREGLPNAVLEAFGCGLATILTPFIGLSDELGCPDQHYVLVDRKPEALAKATIALLESPERRYQLGHQSRKWVEEHMDVEKSLDQYAALYRELVERSRKARL